MTLPRIQFNGCRSAHISRASGDMYGVISKSLDGASKISLVRLGTRNARSCLGTVVSATTLWPKTPWSPGNTGPSSCCISGDYTRCRHAGLSEWFERKFATLYGFLLPRLARRVRAIITVSAF